MAGQLVLRESGLPPKPDTPTNNISSYRNLTIAGNTYRLWGKIRIRDLEPWSASWIPERMYAAGPGAGALDAHYILTLKTEYAKICASPFAGGSTDMDKCFDRVLREIIIPIAIKGSFPIKVATAYLVFNNNLRIHNQYLLGLGKTRQRNSTLLQGCPFSMNLLSMMMTPWCKQVEAHGGIPRVLADDLCTFYTGNDSTIEAFNGFLRTNEYLVHTGGLAKVPKT